VQFRGGFRLLLDAVIRRTNAHPLPYGHWYIEGAGIEAQAPAGLACVSYAALEPVRAALAARMRSGYDSGIGPEALRRTLTAMSPDQVGLSGGDVVWNRFALSLFTEGSGTQVFSTTFVQWAAREVLRRAQPLTLLARFTPRLREQSMDQLLAATRQVTMDPSGSLIDADMGAWYIWLNQQRLSGADKSSFLVWFEGHGEAMAIGPSYTRGTESATPTDLEQLLEQIG
jgi:hypothetical protein